MEGLPWPEYVSYGNVLLDVTTVTYLPNFIIRLNGPLGSSPDAANWACNCYT